MDRQMFRFSFHPFLMFVLSLSFFRSVMVDVCFFGMIFFFCLFWLYSNGLQIGSRSQQNYVNEKK